MAGGSRELHNRTNDAGFYVNDRGLQVGSNGSGAYSGTTDMRSGSTHRIVITRSGGSKQVTAYADGAQKVTFTDSTDTMITSGPGGILHFFKDDGGENSDGVVEHIRTWNTVLTPDIAAPPVAPVLTSISPNTGSGLAARR